jgi:subtilisin family serine protease
MASTILRKLLPCFMAASLLGLGGTQGFAADPTVFMNIKDSGAVVAPNKPQADSHDLFMVSLKKDADYDKFQQFLKENNGTLVRTVKVGSTEILVVQAEAGKAEDMQKKLKTNKEIGFAERNKTYQLNSIPNDPYFSAQWDLAFMFYIEGRNLGVKVNNPVNVYFCDTGVNPLFGEYPFAIKQYDLSNPWHEEPKQEPPHDSAAHGTATSTVLCTTDNGEGLAGLANWEGNRIGFIELRITHSMQPGGQEQGAEGISILNALAYIFGQIQTGRVPAGPVNLSFGDNRTASTDLTLNASPVLQALAGELRSVGSLLVLAAGNDGLEDLSAENQARRVAAIAQDGTIATFSTFGNFGGAAPGVQVPVYIGNFGQFGATLEDGTSFAAPHWAAAVADVMAALPPGKNTASIADNIVYGTATVLPGPTLASGQVMQMHIPNLNLALQAAAQYH